MGSANGIQHYIVTSSLIGCADTQNDLWCMLNDYTFEIAVHSPPGTYVITHFGLCMLNDYTFKIAVNSHPGTHVLTHCGPATPYGWTLAQVMACCLMAPSHYLNQYWLLISVVLYHSPQSPESSFTVIAQATFLYNEFENYTLKIIAICPRGQWVKLLHYTNCSYFLPLTAGGAHWAVLQLKIKIVICMAFKFLNLWHLPTCKRSIIHTTHCVTHTKKTSYRKCSYSHCILNLSYWGHGKYQEIFTWVFSMNLSQSISNRNPDHHLIVL